MLGPERRTIGGTATAGGRGAGISRGSGTLRLQGRMLMGRQKQEEPSAESEDPKQTAKRQAYLKAHAKWARFMRSLESPSISFRIV